jgi:peptidoglycan-N-acetylglucosamine deacetylase
MNVRASLVAMCALLGSALATSLLSALGLPRSTGARLAATVTAWGALTLLLAYLFLPGFDLPWRAKRMVRRAAGARRVALTIDDGPHPDTTPALLQGLARAGVRATFFLVGAAVERWPELARRIVAAGHTVGNHTQRHRLLVFRTLGQLEREVEECQRALAPLGGTRWFRPPHGFKPIGLHRLLARRGLKLVAWQGSIRDTDAPGVEQIVARAMALAAPGRILLLHDNPSCEGQTAAALPEIAARYRSIGLELGSLDEID